MRVPRAGRWGPQRFESRRSREEGWQEGLRRKEGRQAFCKPPSPLSHPHDPIPATTLLGMCTCKEEQVPSLTLACGCKGSSPQAPPSGQGPFPLNHLAHIPLPSSPCASFLFVASFTGLVSTEE